MRADAVELIVGKQPAEETMPSADPDEVKEIMSKMPDVREKYITDDDGIEYILSKDGYRAWSSRPIFADQYLKGGTMLRYDPPKTIILDLSNAEDLATLNNLEKLKVDGGPGVHFACADRQFFEGKFYLYLTYQRIWYKIPN